MRICVVGLFVMLGVAHGDDGILSSKEGDPDQTGRYHDVVTEFVLNHEELDGQRYAVVAEGKVIRFRKKVDVRPLWYVIVRDGTQQLDASGTAVPSNLRPLAPSWTQEFRDGKRIYRRYGNDDTRIYDNDKERDENELRPVCKLIPTYQALCHPNALEDNGTSKQSAENLVRFTLESSEYTKDRNITVTLVREGKDIPSLPENQRQNFIRKSIVFGAKSGFMPIEYRLFVKADPRVIPNPKLALIGHATTTWTRHPSGIYIPAKYTGASFDPVDGKVTDQYEITYQWLIGDELPTNILDLQATDWRQSVQELFDTTWQLPFLPFGQLESKK